MSRCQRGVALLQVLFLSVILSVMLISVHLKAKSAIQLAQDLSDRTAAELKIASADSQLTFMLLTQNMSLKGSEDGLLQWNLYNEPVDFADVVLQIQDTSGLVNLYHHDEMRKLMAFYSDEQTAEKLVARLKDWQDEDNQATITGAEQADYPANIVVRNRPMQTEDELRFLKDMPATLVEQVLPWIVTTPQNFQNPMVMPPTLLEAKYGVQITSELLNLRNSGVQDPLKWQQSIGNSAEDSIGFSPSGSYRVTFTSEVNNVKLSRRYIIRLSPYQEDPFTYWEYLHHYHAESR